MRYIKCLYPREEQLSKTKAAKCDKKELPVYFSNAFSASSERMVFFCYFFPVVPC